MWRSLKRNRSYFICYRCTLRWNKIFFIWTWINEVTQLQHKCKASHFFKSRFNKIIKVNVNCITFTCYFITRPLTIAPRNYYVHLIFSSFICDFPTYTVWGIRVFKSSKTLLTKTYLTVRFSEYVKHCCDGADVAATVSTLAQHVEPLPADDRFKLTQDSHAWQVHRTVKNN